MTKPLITLRSDTAPSPLTYNQLDTNFTNLRDATITVKGDTGTIVNELNGEMTVSGGTALTSSVAGTVLTLNLDNTAVTPGSYTNANITVDAQGRITAAANGSSSGGGIDNPLSSDLDLGSYNIIDLNGSATIKSDSGVVVQRYNTTDSILISPGTTDAVIRASNGKNFYLRSLDNLGNTNASILLTTSGGIQLGNPTYPFGFSSGATDSLISATQNSNLILKSTDTSNQETQIAVNKDGTIVIGSDVPYGSVTIGRSAGKSGALVLLPMTTTDRDARTGSQVQDGMLIYNSTVNKFQGRANGVWVDLH